MLENVNKHESFQILAPQSILLVLIFPRMKTGNVKVNWCVRCKWLMGQGVDGRNLNKIRERHI